MSNSDSECWTGFEVLETIWVSLECTELGEYFCCGGVIALAGVLCSRIAPLLNVNCSSSLKSSISSRSSSSLLKRSPLCIMIDVSMLPSISLLILLAGLGSCTRSRTPGGPTRLFLGVFGGDEGVACTLLGSLFIRFGAFGFFSAGIAGFLNFPLFSDFLASLPPELWRLDILPAKEFRRAVEVRLLLFEAVEPDFLMGGGFLFSSFARSAGET